MQLLSIHCIYRSLGTLKSPETYEPKSVTCFDFNGPDISKLRKNLDNLFFSKQMIKVSKIYLMAEQLSALLK